MNRVLVTLGATSVIRTALTLDEHVRSVRVVSRSDPNSAMTANVYIDGDRYSERQFIDEMPQNRHERRRAAALARARR